MGACVEVRGAGGAKVSETVALKAAFDATV